MHQRVLYKRTLHVVRPTESCAICDSTVITDLACTNTEHHYTCAYASTDERANHVFADPGAHCHADAFPDGRANISTDAHTNRSTDKHSNHSCTDRGAHRCTYKGPISFADLSAVNVYNHDNIDRHDDNDDPHRNYSDVNNDSDSNQRDHSDCNYNNVHSDDVDYNDHVQL
jgi:hypothetical protein